MQEQFARPFGLVVLGPPPARTAGCAALRSQTSPSVEHRVGVAELRLALAQRLDLGADELDPRLEASRAARICGRRAGWWRRRRTRACAPSWPSLLRSGGRPRRRFPCRSRRRDEVDPASGRLDPIDPHRYRIAEPDRPPDFAADQRRLGLVEVEALAAHAARRHEPLVDVAELAAEADERPRPDDARDLALEVCVPPALERARARAGRRRRRSSASRSIAVASRSRSELCEAASRTGPDRGASSPAPTADSSARWTTRSG